MAEVVKKVDANCKLDFKPQNQMKLDFYKPSDDGYSTTGKAQNKEISRHLAASKDRRTKMAEISARSEPISVDAEVSSLAKDIQSSEADAGALGDGDLDVGARAKKAGRKDHIASLFQVPKMRPDTTTNRDGFVDLSEHCKGLDKEYYFKRNAYTEYTEDVVRYKHTMR